MDKMKKRIEALNQSSFTLAILLILSNLFLRMNCLRGVGRRLVEAFDACYFFEFA
jgi:hypothetical protein